jgi:hypothetical protein
MQREAQVWEHLLWTTDSAFKLSKCFYYIIAWDFHKNGVPILLSPQAMPDTQISITSGPDPSPILIEQKDSNSAHVMLGVRPNPSGDTKDQGDSCLSCNNQIAEGVHHSFMACHEALMGHRHIWLPSIG